MNKKKLKKRLTVLVLLILGATSVLLFNQVVVYTSTNDFCASCHVHPQASQNWKLGNHFDTKSGFVANCVDCHLPPAGWDYLQAKVSTGMRDVYGVIFKDISKMNWQLKSTREAAAEHVYKASCLKCHQNLFPRTLTTKGEDAHLYYDQNKEKLRCINCHLQTGHFHQSSTIATDESIKEISDEIYTHPVYPDTFKNFTEQIPGTHIDFELVAVPGGEFLMGSPDDESFRRNDEGPQNKVKVNPFWMGKIEVSWDEYEAFYKETGVKRSNEDRALASTANPTVDAISGPTPPYGNPDQGWGRGKRPAISMSHFAAKTYCEWLSKKTGKTYRLPTEAEWEYACRAGSNGAYFFEGEPDDFNEDGLSNMFFGVDTSINRYVVHAANSNGSTQLPDSKQANAFGLINMLGNVKEFCSDYYRSDAYSNINVNNSGKDEFIIRGGSYKSKIGDVRSAAREYTQTKAWLITDPQMPKSRWWYSDCNDVGFRVVCNYPIKE